MKVGDIVLLNKEEFGLACKPDIVCCKKQDINNVYYVPVEDHGWLCKIVEVTSGNGSRALDEYWLESLATGDLSLWMGDETDCLVKWMHVVVESKDETVDQ